MNALDSTPAVRAADPQYSERLLDDDDMSIPLPSVQRASQARVRASRPRRRPQQSAAAGSPIRPRPAAAASSSSVAGRRRPIHDISASDDDDVDRVLLDLTGGLSRQASPPAAAAAAASPPAAAVAAAAAAAASSPPLIELSRLVDAAAAAGLECGALAGACIDHLPRQMVVMNCTHNCCMECYKGIRASSTAPPCPTCRVPMDKEPRVNFMASAVMATLRVSCIYAGCPAVYPIGLDMASEARHRDNCGYRPVNCPTCDLAMRQSELRTHQCPNGLTPCGHCHEPVRRCDLPMHKGDALGACVNMLACPLGCVDQDSAPEGLGHQPSTKRHRPNEEAKALRQVHATLVPREAMAAHLEVCPSRPVDCPFDGCTHHLVAHELDRHVTMKKYAAHHALCAMKALKAEREANAAGLEQLRRELSPQFIANPFPGYTRVADDVFRLPAGVLRPRHFKWRFGDNKLAIKNVTDIQRIEFDLVTDDNNSEVATVAADVCIEPRALPWDQDGEAAAAAAAAMRGGPRDMAVSVRLCREVRHGDTNSKDGACIVPGVHYARTTASFRTTGNLERRRFDAFTVEMLKEAARADNSPYTHGGGNDAHFWIYTELFERL